MAYRELRPGCLVVAALDWDCLCEALKDAAGLARDANRHTEQCGKGKPHIWLRLGRWHTGWRIAANG